MNKPTKQQQQKKQKPAKPPLPPGARVVAHAQAKAFAANAEGLAAQITIPTDAGVVMAYLVNAGFAVELYFKLFMIAGRNGHISEGHTLPQLLSEFPPFLRNSFNSFYDAHPTARTAQVRLLALTLGEKPAPNYQHNGRYGNFDEAISAIATIFVDARYFFENVRGQDYAVVAYPTDAISAIIHALETTYQKYDSGDLKT